MLGARVPAMHGLLGVLAIFPMVTASSEVLSDLLGGHAVAEMIELVWESPFIQGTCRGDLDAVKFGQYIVQDTGCYMPGAINVLYDLHQRSLKEQGPHNNLTKYFAQMHSAYVTYLAEKTMNLVNINCSKSVQTYLGFLSDVAESQPLLAIIAFAARTERWDWLGKRMMKSCKGPGNAYNDWITGWSAMRIYTDSALIMALVHQVRTSQTIQAVQATQTFLEALRREYHFFNSVVDEIPREVLIRARRAVEGDSLLCLGVAYLIALMWARVTVASGKVWNEEAQQALLK